MSEICLKIASGICSCQWIQEQFSTLSTTFIQQKPCSVCIDPTSFIHLGQHFHNTRCSVNTKIFGNDIIHICLGKLQLIQHCLLRQSTGRNTVCTIPPCLPESRTMLVGFPQCSIMIQFQHCISCRIYKPNNVKNLPKLINNSLYCHSICCITFCKAIQNWDICRHLLRPDQLPDCSDIMFRGQIRPERMYPQITPLILISLWHHDTH